MATLKKVIKVTKAQYNILSSGGRVGDYVGLNDDYIYLIEDNTEYVDVTTVDFPDVATYLDWDTTYILGSVAGQHIRVTMPEAPVYSWSDIPDVPSTFPPSAHNHSAAEITSGTLADARIPSLSTNKITSGTFAVDRIPNIPLSKITDVSNIGTTAVSTKTISTNSASIASGNTDLVTGGAIYSYVENEGGKVKSLTVGTTNYTPVNGIITIPTYPSVSDSIITIKQAGISDQTFTLNGSAKTITLVDKDTTYSAGSGLILDGTTFKHSNSVTTQNTQAVYPIKIDGQGHISGYGSAVTSMPASDVYSWAKAATKPAYTLDEVSDGSTRKLSDYLPKVTYEWNKSISFGNSGFLKIGAFDMYDSNVTIEIDSTTYTTFHGRVVIATQNTTATSIGSAHVVHVYDDPTGTIANSLRVVWNSGSRAYHVYFVPPAWSKNLIHIRAIGLYGFADICVSQTGTVPTTTAGLEPVNILNVNNATLTIQKNGTSVQTFSANASTNVTCNITVPTVITDLGGWSTVGTTAVDTISITTAVNSSSTDSQIPTAKAVWDVANTAGKVKEIQIGGATQTISAAGVVNLPAYPTTLPASDVYNWAKAVNKPTYTASEVSALPDTTSFLKSISNSGNTYTITNSANGKVSWTIPVVPTLSISGRTITIGDNSTTWTDTNTAGLSWDATNHAVKSSLDNTSAIIPTATTSVQGIVALGTAATQAAAGNHSHSAYVNQNAYGNIKVGSTTTAAASVTDTITFAAGGDLGVSINGKTITYTVILPTTLPASDVSAWAKAATKPAYTLDEVSDGNTRKLANYLLKTDISDWAKAATKPTYDWSEITNKPFSGITFVSGNSGTGEHNANNITNNGVYYYSSNGPTYIGEKSTDGALYAQAYSTSWVGQIAQDYRNGSIFLRGKNSGSWTKWKKVIDTEDMFVMSSDMYYNPTSQTLACSKSSNGWSSGAYSTTGYKTNCYVKARSTATNTYIMFGLNTDPSTDHNYTSIDYAMYVSTNTVAIYENGQAIGNFGTNAAGDEYKVEYVNGYIRYYHNNECIRSVARSVGSLLYFDSSFHTSSCSLTNVEYGALPQSFVSKTQFSFDQQTGVLTLIDLG